MYAVDLGSYVLLPVARCPKLREGGGVDEPECWSRAVFGVRKLDPFRDREVVECCELCVRGGFIEWSVDHDLGEVASFAYELDVSVHAATALPPHPDLEHLAPTVTPCTHVPGSLSDR